MNYFNINKDNDYFGDISSSYSGYGTKKKSYLYDDPLDCGSSYKNSYLPKIPLYEPPKFDLYKVDEPKPLYFPSDPIKDFRGLDRCTTFGHLDRHAGRLDPVLGGPPLQVIGQFAYEIGGGCVGQFLPGVPNVMYQPG